MQELRQPTPLCQGSVTTRTRPHARLRVEPRAAAGGTPHVDVIAWIYLPHLIVDEAQRFLADHA